MDMAALLQNINFFHFILTLHIIAVISWMAGLLYLPRLFVYHASTQSPETQATFKIMEHRLLYYIMNPALVLVILTGHFLALIYRHLHPTHMDWLYIKVALVAGLVLCHACCYSMVKLFKAHANRFTPRFYRIFNEIPTLLMIGIVILVIYKP